MPLPSSGEISLNQVNTELAIPATTTISLNQTNVRTLAGVPSGQISMANLQGKSSASLAFAATISSNQQELNLRTWALANGWNGSSAAQITIGSGVYIWSDNTGTPALSTSGPWPGGLTLVNNGFIMGKGGSSGNPGGAGGPAISLGSNITINNTNGSAYIGGGGGGGGALNAAQGGGGAGGGGANPGGLGGTGGNGSVGTGGSGGRIFPGSGGTGGVGATGGSGGGAGGGGSIGTATSNPRTGTPVYGLPGGGGGGWGASGGLGYNALAGTPGSGGSANNAGSNAAASGTAYSGGAGGRAVQLNGNSVSWVSGDTARVWGAVS
jgi:hypothetical protein